MSLSAGGDSATTGTGLEGASANDDEVSAGEDAGEVSMVPLESCEGPDSFSTSFNPCFSFSTIDDPSSDVLDALPSISRGCVRDVPVHGTSLRISLEKNEGLDDGALLYTFAFGLPEDLPITAGFST